MDSDQQVYGINSNEEPGLMIRVEEYNYSGYSFQNVIERDWCNVFISKKQITFEDTVYRANDKQLGAKKGSKAHYWNEEAPDSMKKMYEKCTVQSLKQTDSIIAVCQKKKQTEYSFIVKPAAHNRKSFLVRIE